MSEGYEITADGVYRRYGKPRDTSSMPGEVQTYSAGRRALEMDFEFNDYPDFTADLDADGTDDGWSGNDVFIPAGSYITSAYLIVETAFAGGTSYNIGLYEADGTAIDADGIDAAVAVADMNTADVVVCNGALVGGAVTIGADDAYVKAVPTGTYTAGKAKLVIEFIPVTV